MNSQAKKRFAPPSLTLTTRDANAANWSEIIDRKRGRMTRPNHGTCRRHILPVTVPSQKAAYIDPRRPGLGGVPPPG
jgi:hypothetical protein